MGSLHAETMDLVEGRVGQVLRDKWRVDSLIGVGGMAAVYAATHRNGNRVALKVLHAQLSIDKNIRTRFTREGYVANMITHPGIVRVLDDDVTDEGAVFLVMDLLEGETAEARARRMGDRLPSEDVLLIADGLLDVIAAAHDAGVVHRDIKPENVFVTLEREIKVLDFGIARMRDGFAGNSGVKTAAMMGTPAFMPPEQALGRMQEVDALSDVWAVGATMFNLLSGQLVHEAETPNELLVLAATAVPRSLAVVAPDVPPAIVEIVDRALAVEKTKRWSSARAMQHALRQAAVEVLRAPLPPVSARFRVQTAPQAFRPAAIESLMGREDTVAESAEWNAESGVSPRRAAINAANLKRAQEAQGRESSTFQGVGGAARPRSSSGKRVLMLAGIASLLVAIAGTIGVGLALRAQSGGHLVPAAAAAQGHDPLAQAPLQAPTNEPTMTNVTQAPVAKNVEPAASAPIDDTTFTAKTATPPTPPPRSEGRAKKSWLDRRK